MDLVKCILTFCLLIVFFDPVAGEVTTSSVATDNTWKSLDFENDGWTSFDYDDSWWESAYERRSWDGVESGKSIWYPGEIDQNPVYFRSTFNIDGVKILNGKAYVDISDGTYDVDGIIYLYINDNSLDKIVSQGDTAAIDITPYIKPGKNVIAAKVDIPDPGYGRSWAFFSTIRYDKTASGQPIT